MLHVFLVDTGIMLKFDMELAVESVGRLMESIYERVFIPSHKQVLVTANGEALLPSNRVASYVCCGTENQPIFLFSKSTIESPVPPSPSINFGSEASLKIEVSECMRMPPTYETLVARAKLASDFHKYALELGENCEAVVNDQRLQKDGWLAVVKNLDLITSAFKTHLKVFEDKYRNFLYAQLQYNNMVDGFSEVVSILKQLPLLPSLCKDDSQEITLLQWISSHDQQASLEHLVRQCHDTMKQCNIEVLGLVKAEAYKALDSENNALMKEIKGLTERLLSLEKHLSVAKRYIQDQTDMAQGFLQNQKRAENIGDPSVLPDLCASHQQQLRVLSEKHYHIRKIRNLCAQAKDELSANLHARLRWIMHTEKTICECDNKLMVYGESLSRSKKRLDIFEQIYEAPKMYVLAVLEVLRRKSFSAQFSEWSKTVLESSVSTRMEELNKRDNFHSVLNNHFVQNLFPGLDRRPEPFAEEPAEACDNDLPDITVDDIKLLQQRVPKLMSDLSLCDPLETSIVVRNCLSQSNLTKLVDPKQNKTIEETLQIREKALVDNQALTMSVLKREISSKTVDHFPIPADIQFQVGSVGDDSQSEFEPASLRSLSEDKKLKTSSDSDALFHSAELDFSCSIGSLSPQSTAEEVSLSSKLQELPSSLSSKDLPSLKSPCSDTSPNSISGKSSSSPIAIRSSTIINTYANNHSQSFSPKADTPIRNNVSGKSSLTNFASFPPDLSSSINSSRSLSDAIRSTKVTQGIADSAEIVKRMKDELLCLKDRLKVTRNDVEIMKATSTETLTHFHDKIVEKFKVLDICLNCETLRENIDSEHLRYSTELDTLRRNHEELVNNHGKMKSENIYMKDELTRMHKEKDMLENNIGKSNNEVKRIQSENDILKNSVEESRNEVTKVKSENDILKSNVLDYQGQITCLKINLETEGEELKTKVISLEELNKHIEELNKHIESLMVANKHLKTDIVDKEKLSTTFSLEKEELEDKLVKITNDYKAICKENEETRERLQISNDAHLEHVSAVNIQNKELKKKIATIEVDLVQTSLVNDTLETQKQTTFNVVFNKIRKEKDNQIRELSLKIKDFEKMVACYENKTCLLNQEINMHKEAYSQLSEESRQNVNKLNMIIELNKKELFTFRNENVQLNESNIAYKNEIKELTININEMKAEKLRVMNELKLQYDKELEKEKASLLLAFELEKESALEEKGKSEHALVPVKSAGSIEEGIDELEVERLWERIKLLEAENKTLSTEAALAASSVKEPILEGCTIPTEKLALKELKVGDLIIICIDDSINQYTVLTLTDEKYYIHPECHKKIIHTGKGNEKRQWMFAYLTGQEYCIAKKASNKFNLPVNTYFSRVHVKLYDEQKSQI